MKVKNLLTGILKMLMNLNNFKNSISYGTQWVRIGSVQICWETVNVYVTANGVGTVTWTYPKAFGYTPMVNGSILFTDYPTAFDISPYSKSASATTFKIRSQSNTGYTMYADVIAIGHI